MEGMTEQFRAFVPGDSQSVERQDVLRTASEVNHSGGFKGGSSVKIAYSSKEYYTGIPITRCKTEDVEKLAYYYDAKNDAIFEESELNQRYVVFYFILFLCSLLLWLYPEVSKRKESQK